MLGLHGAEIVFVPSATTSGHSDNLWKIEQTSMAIANGYFVGTNNRVGREAPWNFGEFYGSSYFCNPYGEILSIGSRDKDELVVADLDLDLIDKVRAHWQFYRDRRPESYARHRARTCSEGLRGDPMALDRVLKGGRLVDGTGAPARLADVGIRGGRIAVDRRRPEPRPRSIDCAGHVVCPGFIDTHSHSDVKVLADPLLPMKVRQGITLEVFGQDGISVAPVRGEERAAWKQKLSGLLGDFGVEWDWSSVGEYLARVAARGAGVRTSPISSPTGRSANT